MEPPEHEQLNRMSNWDSALNKHIMFLVLILIMDRWLRLTE